MALDTGINPKIVRRLNTVEVIDVATTTQSEKTNVKSENSSNTVSITTSSIFKGYLTTPLGSFATDIKLNSLNSKFMDKLQDVLHSGFAGKGALAAASRLIASAGQLANAEADSALQNGLLYDRMYEFAGTSEFTKQFSCMLVAEEDFFDDVVEPLYKLLKYVVPATGGHLEQTKLVSGIDSGLKSADFGDNFQWAKDVLVKLWETAKDFVGDAWIYEKSDMLKSGHKTMLKIGNHITIDDVLIKNISFDIPELLYEDGLFDHVKVTFTVTGKRNVSLDTFDWVNNILMKRADFDSANTLTLNQYYE